MNTPGMQLVNHCFKLFDALPWHQLIPDTNEQIVVTGRGTFGWLDYACAAKASDDSFYVIYIPTGRTLYFNLHAMSESVMRMHWYNPRTGQFIRIGHAGHDSHFGVVTPDDDDWVLIFDGIPDWQLPG